MSLSIRCLRFPNQSPNHNLVFGIKAPKFDVFKTKVLLQRFNVEAIKVKRNNKCTRVQTFSGFYIRNCLNCVHNCEDHSLLNKCTVGKFRLSKRERPEQMLAHRRLLGLSPVRMINYSNNKKEKPLGRRFGSNCIHKTS